VARSQGLAWLSGGGLLLCGLATLASLTAFGYEGEGWVFMLPAPPLVAVFLPVALMLISRYFARRRGARQQ